MNNLKSINGPENVKCYHLTSSYPISKVFELSLPAGRAVLLGGRVVDEGRVGRQKGPPGGQKRKVPTGRVQNRFTLDGGRAF
ncbi:hypothetical protein Tco_0698289 [Tanacetum coccineum]